MELADITQHAREVSGRLMDFGGKVRAAIDAADEAGDQDTADLFTEGEPGRGQGRLVRRRPCGGRRARGAGLTLAPRRP